MVAPLRISRDANSGNTSSSSGTRAGQRRLDLGQGERGADQDVVVADRELAQLGQPVDRHGVRRPRRRGC